MDWLSVNKNEAALGSGSLVLGGPGEDGSTL